jgi:hypothetical protein
MTAVTDSERTLAAAGEMIGGALLWFDGVVLVRGGRVKPPPAQRGVGG